MKKYILLFLISKNWQIEVLRFFGLGQIVFPSQIIEVLWIDKQWRKKKTHTPEPVGCLL